MKFFAVFAAVLALAAAAPTTQWTLNDLSQALQNPATPAAAIPYLQQALNTMMESVFAGQPIETIAVPTPAGLLPVEAVSPAVVMPVEVAEPVAPVAVAEPTTQWTLNDLSMALQNPATPTALIPYLQQALNTMMESLFAGQPIETVVVPTPAGLLPVEAVSPAVVMPVEVAEPTTQWTLNDLSMALQNPATPAALIPYLEQALNTMMESVFAGQPIETIVVSTPAGLLPVEAVSPIEVAEPVAPVVVEPTPAVIADASGSPLVQIIINIKSQEVAPETPATVVEAEESPALIPSPVIVEPEAPESVPIAPIAPGPVIVAPEVNPIDVIAVVAPETNPIDLLQPVPVAVAGGASQGILV